MKLLLDSLLNHQDVESRLTGEQCKRLIAYAHSTYFKHIRLYDFVIKNTKLSEKKYITLAQQEPNCGTNLNKAMVIEDNVTRHFYQMDDEPVKADDGISEGAVTIEELNRHSQEQLLSNGRSSELSQPKTEFTERLAQANLDDKTKHVVQNTVNDWTAKINATLTKDVSGLLPATGKK